MLSDSYSEMKGYNFVPILQVRKVRPTESLFPKLEHSAAEVGFKSRFA